MSNRLSFISNCLLILSAVAFLLFYFVLSFYNRPAADDLSLIARLKGKNIIEYVSYYYHTWEGRWAAFAYFFTVTGAANTFQEIHHYVFIYYLLTILLLVWSMHIIIRFCIHELFRVTMNAKTTFIYSILFIAAFYFFTFEYIEAWWWICSGFYYLQGIVFLLVGTALILLEKKNIFIYLLIAFSFIYVGSCFEIYALIVGCLFLSAIIYLKKPDAWLSFKNNRCFKAFVTAFLSLALSAVICLAAPGNRERKNQFSQTAKNYTTSLTLHKKYLAAMGISALWLLLGMKLKEQAPKPIDTKRIKKAWLLVSVVLLLSIIITRGFQFIFLDDAPIPIRSWTFTSFACCIFSCFMFLWMGYSFRFSTPISGLINIFLPATILVILSLNLYKQYNYVSRYAKQYDQLIALIEDNKNNNAQNLFVNELPDSGMLMQLNIKDPYVTTSLKEIFNFRFEIKVIEK